MSENHEPGMRKKRRDPRYDFRAASHESAHANNAGRPAGKIPDHPLVPKNPATLITTADALAELIEHLRGSGSFAYDSEFIGELSYYPKLCLIQVATRQRVALIDALAGPELGGFWELVVDPAVEKVVHAGQQDVEPAYRLLGKPPANIFDTQVAAGFMGLSYPVGLSKLVHELVGVSLGKAFTFTHWDQRPLSAVQLRYAADDVRYLPAMRDAIGRRLEALGHVSWAVEECETMCDPEMFRADPADVRRIRGANTLSAKNAAILRELLIWRDAAARRYDVPPRSYVKDDVMLEMARKPVEDVAGLARVRGLPRPVEEAEGGSIVEAIQRGMAVPEAQLPPSPHGEETPAERFSVDALWSVVQAWCHGNEVDPALATSRHEIRRFCRAIRNGKQPESERLMRGWRWELLGEVLTGFLHGQKSLNMRWEDCAIRAEAQKREEGTGR